MTNSTEINAAAEALKNGGLVAFPTETVYGLGADATSDQAVAKLFAAKGRPSFNPLISHVHAAEAAFALGEFSAEAKKLAQAFWPGPLTVVVPRAAGCPVSLLASAGLSSIALRVPNHPLALELLRAVDRPVVAPSANLSGRVSPTTAAHVKRGLGKKAAVILDGGPCTVGVESTVVSFMKSPPRCCAPADCRALKLRRCWAMSLLSKRIRRSPIRRGRWKAITRRTRFCGWRPRPRARAKAIWALAPMLTAPTRFRRGAMWWKPPPTSFACCMSSMGWA